MQTVRNLSTGKALESLTETLALHSFSCCLALLGSLACSPSQLCYCSFPLHSTLSCGHWSAPSLRPNSSDLRPAMTSFPLQRGFGECKALPARVRTAETMKSSPAFQKTKQLFEDDRRFALQQVRAASGNFATAAPAQGHKHSHNCYAAARQTQQRASLDSSASLAQAHSEGSGNSMADSVSSYHGYAGVNYQSSKCHTSLDMRSARFTKDIFHVLTCLGMFQVLRTLMLCQTSGATVSMTTKRFSARSMSTDVSLGRTSTSANNIARHFRSCTLEGFSCCRSCMALNKTFES